MAAKYKVVAPYVTLKVKDATGATVVTGFYEGGTVPDNVDPDNLQHHLDTGLVAEDGSDLARFAAPSGTPKPGEPPNVPVTEQPANALPLDERLRRQAEAAQQGDQRDGRPSVRASKDEWVERAVAQRSEGTSEDDARAEAQGMSKAELVAKFGG